jgi:hypothetical protein
MAMLNNQRVDSTPRRLKCHDPLASERVHLPALGTELPRSFCKSGSVWKCNLATGKHIWIYMDNIQIQDCPIAIFNRLLQSVIS